MNNLFEIKNNKFIISNIIYKINFNIVIFTPSLNGCENIKIYTENQYEKFLIDMNIFIEYNIPVIIRCCGDYVFFDNKCIFDPNRESDYVYFPDHEKISLFDKVNKNKLNELRILYATH